MNRASAGLPSNTLSLFLVVFLGGIGSLPQISAEDARRIPPNRWVKLHEQKTTDAVRFRRQPHGGSCFDTKRGRLILFGSDTHGRDWTNSPLIFEIERKRWIRTYANDERETYAANRDGTGVAGKKGNHPWAMHTFGTVLYDPGRDEMVVACAPKHMVPGRFTNSVKDLWPKIKTFPTWTFNLKTNHWKPLPCKAVDFFPHSAAFDSDRKVVLGYRSDGIWELSGAPRSWKRVTRKVFLGGWHSNCAYDSKNKALVIFGTNTNSNDIEAFYPANGRHQLMPTPGPRPPKDQHNPMDFYPPIGQTVVLVDRKREDKTTVTETWTYDLARDSWTQITKATLPFGCGMNYNLEYDPKCKVLLLVTGDHRRPTTVWALKIENEK